jgi:tetratricopeptide (TPR) repeat protein
MWRRRFFALALLLPWLADCPVAARAEDDAWVDQEIIPKKASATLRANYDDHSKVVGHVRDASVTVARVKDDWLFVRSRGVEGWLPRSEAVLVEDAAAHFAGVLRRDPSDARAHAMRAWALHAAHAYDKAIKDHDEAIRLQPNCADWYGNRAATWAAKKDYDKAIADFTRALRISPDDSETFRNRAVLWTAKKEYAKAIADLETALQLRPKDGNLHSDLAWLLATSPTAKLRNGKRAVKAATRACELTSWDDPDCFTSLAAAYAESGDFDQATHWQQKALDFPAYAKQHGKKGRGLLDLYEIHQPYRQD